MLNIVILAAGKGSRMQSRLPKVMHLLAGEPILFHVIRTAKILVDEFGGAATVVTGHGREQIDDWARNLGCHVAYQERQLGTGHALSVALQNASADGKTLVLYGDVPLVTPDILRPLLAASDDQLSVLTAMVKDPTGYGRIIRNGDGDVLSIVEHRDASETERAICEINSGIYSAPTALFQRLLPQVKNSNVQEEYYLTDCVALAVAEGAVVHGITGPEAAVMGINDKAQLAQMEQLVQTERRNALLEAGVTLRDPSTVYIMGEVEVGTDVVIEPNVTLIGPLSIGAGSHIGFGCHLTRVEVAEQVVLKPYSVLEDTHVGEAAQVGPFARLRPGTRLAANTHIGNFVETKNAEIGPGSKVNHLSYIGDASVGQSSNVGAGTITCNYDGANKHRTVLGDRVFVGSNSSLVAPVTVGDGATLGAGSVITRDVEPDALAVSRAPQKSIPSYQRPKKAKE